MFTQEPGTSKKESFEDPGCEIIRSSYLAKGISKETVDVMMASLAPSTYKQYGTTLKEWKVFCVNENIGLFSATPEELLKFLTIKFKQGTSYGSLNSHRSAISLISMNKGVGEHEDVKRFFKGIFRLKPPKPKYEYTWDVSKVLDHVANWFPLEDMSIEKLTRKTVILLALCTAHRAQTLAAIETNNILTSDDGIEIRVPAILKTSKPESVQPRIVLPFFHAKPELCVAGTIMQYLKITDPYRRGNTKLFLGTKKPYHPVSVQSISRWIKDVLRMSGLDTKIFTGHSTRHAATSVAFQKGMDFQTIRRTAGWSEKSNTFAKFYNKPLDLRTEKFCMQYYEHK